MLYGKASLGFLTDDELEILWHDARDIQHAVRCCGCYALANHLQHFVTDCVVEISRRDALRRAGRQLSLVDRILEDVTASSETRMPGA